MTGYRITARSLESRFVSDSVLKEVSNLEDCARVDEQEVAHRALSGRVVFVLEDSEDELPPTTLVRRK